VSKGKVIFSHDSEPDHAPVAGSDPDTPANMIVVQDGNTRYIYVHLKQGSATVTVGAAVTVGQVLGHVGNNGYSSGPHLHFGVYTQGRFYGPSNFCCKTAQVCAAHCKS
jgi:murein DD-endopeptidase MepM/ murein hydrolase activator NlpD